ncbi:hypothetical protein M7I_6277 [Glarea lozoyensis 74030]|uniref:ABM domain-containing protein n=1 Tax=Glarea lozoyensis (strain ATCC 74030 / MF5533) TaxID=1104152 RepID=H0EU48_GLAL7|nr:hypothetical protein M7I_6277 [Glarea lozoyensis 74030]
MPSFIEVQYFSAPSSTTNSNEQESASIIHQATKAVQDVKAEWTDGRSYADVQNSSEYKAVTEKLQSTLGTPKSIFHVELSRRAFGPGGPLTGAVVEYVQAYYPVSQATPEFQKDLGVDFLRFEKIFQRDGPNGPDLAYGWVVEEQEHESVQGEKTKCWFIARRWESMADFERAMQTQAFKDAFPILMAWQANFKMVCFCFVALECYRD